MAVDLGAVAKKREQRYSYGLSLLRDSIEKKERFPPGDEDIGKKIVLSVKNITLTFGGLSALSSVDLDLREGELLAIIGPNGAGKSTICQRLSFGMLENESRVTLVSTQQTTKGFINQMYSLDYPIGSYLLNGGFLYIPVIPLMQAAKSRIDFIERLMGAKELFENDVIIIDTISSLIKYSVDAEKSLDLISFFKKLNGMGKVIILTIEPSQLDEDVNSGRLFQISIEISSFGLETCRRPKVGSLRAERFTPMPGVHKALDPAALTVCQSRIAGLPSTALAGQRRDSDVNDSTA